MTIFTVSNTLRAGAVSALLFLVCAGARAQNADSARISELFQQIKTHAVAAEKDAVTLEMYNRSGVSWQAHATKLNQIRDHVNALGKDYAEAAQLRDEGSAWQKEAIDKVEPLLKGMAGHLQASIEHLNENKSHAKMIEFRDYLKAHREYAERTASLINDIVEYEEARDKADSFEQKLGLPSGSQS